MGKYLKGGSMKILAMADLHGKFDDPFRFQGEGLTIVAGDFAYDDENGMVKSERVEDRIPMAEWVKSRLCQFCCEYGRCQSKVVMVLGNHDRFVHENFDRTMLPENLNLLCDSGCTIGGLKIYGTSWCPWDKDERGKQKIRSQIFEDGSGMLRLQFSKIPEGLDILISHCPPRSDAFRKYSGKSSSELYDRIVEMKKPPKLIVCGHYHGPDSQNAIEDEIICANKEKSRILCVAKTSKLINFPDDV